MKSFNNLPSWANAEACQLLPTLVAQGEGQCIEFKERLPEQAHDIGKSMAAFASSDGGYLIYGVTDDSGVVGLADALDAKGRDRIAQRILGAAREVRPPVHPSLLWALHEERVACLVKIDKGVEAIYYSNQRPIVRRFNMSRPAEPGEVEQIFRARYLLGQKAMVLPSTQEIMGRMRRVIELMNTDRFEPVAVADLARAMDLSSPADLEAVLEGHQPATFALLDQFCDSFAVNKEWLTTGRASPFSSVVEHHPLPENYLDSIEKFHPEAVYAVRSKSKTGEAFLIVESSPLKYLLLPDMWHVSDQVGGGGARQLLSLFKLFKHWSKAQKPYVVLGREASPEVAASIYNGEVHPGIVEKLPLSHWWDDLTDLGHEWTTREDAAESYGNEFVLAQDIVRDRLSRGQ
jgi:hypothetical protein